MRLRVTPRASSERIAVEETPDGPLVRVWVTAPPAEGAANAAVIKLLAKALRIPKSRLEIAAGAGSRDKRLRIAPG
jgi:uncharacterized protein YggU (UPF0235/DUF167 family)